MKNIVGKRIKDARNAHKMTQRDLAEAANISTSYMNLIESGRRPIGGTLLRNIAQILQTDSEHLSSDIPKSQIESVLPTTEKFGVGRSELEKLFVESPQWIKVLQGLGHENEALIHQLDEVTNSLNLDGGFSETFHDLLSRIASIRSTASILNTQGDLSREKESQFRDILHKEARNASDVARQLMVHFEKTGRAIGSDVSSLQNLSMQLFAGHYYVPFLEDCGGACSPTELSEFLTSEYGEDVAANPVLLRLFVTFAKDVAAMPKAEFIDVASDCNWDCERLSVAFDTSLDRVLRRVAMLSSFSELPRVSLNIYDQMGAVWLASPVTSFSGYKKIGCSLWPIFDVSHNANVLVERDLKIGALDQYHAKAASGLPDLETRARSTDRIVSMISYASKEDVEYKDVHIDCRACNKTDCLSRRNRAISI